MFDAMTSDAILICIVGGLVGAFIWLLLLRNTIVMALKEFKHWEEERDSKKLMDDTRKTGK
jgi:hypothetical protein